MTETPTPFRWTADSAATAQRNAAVRAASDALSGRSFSGFPREQRHEIALHIMLRSLHRQARMHGISVTYQTLCYALSDR